MPFGSHGVPIHSFRFVRRTGSEVVYAEPRRKCAFNAVIGALCAGPAAYLLLRLGLLGQLPHGQWIRGCLNSIRNAESWGQRVPSLIMLVVCLSWAASFLFFTAVFLRSLAPRELTIRLQDRFMVLRKVPFFWAATERVFRAGEVDAVELVIRGRRYDQDWAWLRLRLKKGRTVKLDDGRLTAEFSQMASEIAAALGARQV